MPFEGQLAKHHILKRLVEDGDVQALLRRCDVPTLSAERSAERIAVRNGIEVLRSTWLPKLAIAIDGSNHPVEHRRGYPGAELGFFSIASVILDIELLRALDQRRPVNPAEYNKVEAVKPFTFALSGANMVEIGHLDARQSFRQQFFETLERSRPREDCESLLESYEHLLKTKPDTRPQQCPYMNECPEGKSFKRQTGRYICDCSKRRPIYSTDALRLHERFQDGGSNGAVFGEVMLVTEHLWLIAYLRAMEKLRWWPVFKNLAFVMDGPLRIFGQPAWLSQAIKREIQRINGRVKEATSQDILLFGIEKTGMFFDHLCKLDQSDKGIPNQIVNGTFIPLTDRYVKHNIIHNSSEKLYGADTYYGRKYFYKTKTGAMIVGVSPFLYEEMEDTTSIELTGFPRISDTLTLLDSLVSRRYPNSIIPLISAHAEASIPLKMGREVLTKLAQDLLGTGVAE